MALLRFHPLPRSGIRCATASEGRNACVRAERRGARRARGRSTRPGGFSQLPGLARCPCAATCGQRGLNASRRATSARWSPPPPCRRPMSAPTDRSNLCPSMSGEFDTRERAGRGASSIPRCDRAGGQGLGCLGESDASWEVVSEPGGASLAADQHVGNFDVPQGLLERRLNALETTGTCPPEGAGVRAGAASMSRVDYRPPWSRSGDRRRSCGSASPPLCPNPAVGALPSGHCCPRSTVVRAPDLVTRSSSDEPFASRATRVDPNDGERLGESEQPRRVDRCTHVCRENTRVSASDFVEAPWWASGSPQRRFCSRRVDVPHAQRTTSLSRWREWRVPAKFWRPLPGQERSLRAQRNPKSALVVAIAHRSQCAAP